ncbi:phospholipase D-like domain-containing protein [Pontibacter mangrovi]|uniref:PLD phosphodiesterase domain-containing protein n=1 Tax=Pontibacter mangrovi TaxID=2589816 RepID=A0A501W259_9BACT|nr:hypothetical protein [Pontibacter mangrovi]TPE43348.1 hypothetical protein FJM65_14655 [Pontibacter mangrovi]
MLFDLPDQKAEIWIGSHNLTNRALNGGNMEASTVINCDRDSQLYNQVNDYLYEIKNKYEAYDPSLLEIYQSIQNDKTEANQESELVYTIPFIGNNITELPNQTVMLLGENAADLQSLGLGRVNQDVYIRAVDIKSNEEVDFKATVINSGRIINAEPKSYKMSFSDRLYAIRKGPFFPYQSRRSKELTATDLIKFSYYANIVVEAPLKGHELKPVNSQGNKLWHWEKEEPVRRKTHGSSRNWWELPEETEDEIVVYRAVINSQAKPDNNKQQPEETKYSLKAAFSRPEREEILSFFNKHFELPFFDTEQIGRFPELKLPEKGSYEFDVLLKDFRRERLGRKMRLVKIKRSRI